MGMRLFSTSFPGIKRITMPRLSPSFESALLLNWRVQPGQFINPHGALFDVRTSSLTQEQSRLKDEKIDLIIETIDGGFVSNLLISVGMNVPMGTTLAYIADEKEDFEHFSSITNVSTFRECDEFLWQVQSTQILTFYAMLIQSQLKAYLTTPSGSPTCS